MRGHCRQAERGTNGGVAAGQQRNLLPGVVASNDPVSIRLSRKRLAAGRAAVRKIRAVLRLRTATLRKSLVLPANRSMTLRIGQALRSSGRGALRPNFGGITAAAATLNLGFESGAVDAHCRLPAEPVCLVPAVSRNPNCWSTHSCALV